MKTSFADWCPESSAAIRPRAEAFTRTFCSPNSASRLLAISSATGYGDVGQGKIGKLHLTAQI
jgi:hypothetical protein